MSGVYVVEQQEGRRWRPTKSVFMDGPTARRVADAMNGGGCGFVYRAKRYTRAKERRRG